MFVSSYPELYIKNKEDGDFALNVSKHSEMCFHHKLTLEWIIWVSNLSEREEEVKKKQLKYA